MNLSKNKKKLSVREKQNIQNIFPSITQTSKQTTWLGCLKETITWFGVYGN